MSVVLYGAFKSFRGSRVGSGGHGALRVTLRPMERSRERMFLRSLSHKSATAMNCSTRIGWKMTSSFNSRPCCTAQPEKRVTATMENRADPDVGGQIERTIRSTNSRTNGHSSDQGLLRGR